MPIKIITSTVPLFHITNKNLGPTVKWEPHIPYTAGSREDRVIPRITFCPTLEGCLKALAGTNDWESGLRDLIGPERTKNTPIVKPTSTGCNGLALNCCTPLPRSNCRTKNDPGKSGTSVPLH